MGTKMARSLNVVKPKQTWRLPAMKKSQRQKGAYTTSAVRLVASAKSERLKKKNKKQKGNYTKDFKSGV